MANHTPGPWAISQHDPRLVKHLSGPVLAECGPVNTEEAQANARLIAAAPELLASLRRVLRMLEIHDARLANFGEVEEARLIISRAEGAPYWGE